MRGFSEVLLGADTCCQEPGVGARRASSSGGAPGVGGRSGELDLDKVRQGQVVKMGLKMSPGQHRAQEVHTSKPLVGSFQEERNK